VPAITYTTTMGAPRTKVWDFVRDMDNWAPFTRGYQSHEIVNERESLWVVKGDLGPISRVTKVHVTITEWVEGERVGFVVKGLNEPLSGGGAIQLGDAADGARTEIRGDATIEFGGSLGPVVNHLIGPFVEDGADDLVVQIVKAVTGEDVARQKTSRLRLALAVAWNVITLPLWLLGRLWHRLRRRGVAA
jgi:carbon monoxide dehydrogenase subunit G